VDGRITLREASEHMGISCRYAQRFKRKFKPHGARRLVHGKKCRPFSGGLGYPLEEQIDDLSQNPYTNFNDTHVTEKLNLDVIGQNVLEGRSIFIDGPWIKKIGTVDECAMIEK
jgi:hypothetical protein